MGETIKKPDVRFRGFTDAWEQRKLGDIGSVAMCRRIFKHQTLESGEIPFFKIGTFGGEPDAFITRELFEEFKAKYPYPDKGDILISASGSIGRTVEFTGENEYFQDSNIVWLKHDKSIINPFLRHLYSVVEWAGIEGSTIKRLYNDNILKTEVMLPSVQEQTKIAEMLDGIDSLITLHQCKYLMFPAFSQINKSLSDTLSWEQRKLGDMAERVTRKNQDLECDLPLTISAQYGLIDQNEFFDKRIASKDVSGYYLLKKGEYAYNKSTSNDAPWGAVKRLDRYEMGVVSTLYIVFKLREAGNIDTNFFSTYYDTSLWHKGIQNIAAEGARNHGLLNIAPADFFNTVLSVPQDIDEQKRIGAFFADLDNLITLHQC